MSIIEWQKPKYKITTFEEVEKYIKIFASSTACSGETPCTGGEGGCSCAYNCDPLAGGFSCYSFFILFG